MKFELHCHSKYSESNIPWDGMEEPEDIISCAKRKGLSGIALTDHDTINGWEKAEKRAKEEGILFVPGIEISSANGHILGLGINQKIEKGLSIEETIDKIHDAGGIGISAHPFDIRGYGTRNRFVKADAVEVFNALSLDRFSNILSESKARRADKPMVSGSDAHSLSMIGRASIQVDAHDIDSLLKAIKKGKAKISKNYVMISELEAWNKCRMINAYLQILRYIDARFGRISSYLIKHMMRRFMLSESTVWSILARFGVVSVMGYGAIKAFSRY